MEFVIPLWVFAMVAGLCWARWAVALSTGSIVVTFLAAAVFLRTVPQQPMQWLELVALTITPWLVAAQRARYQRTLRRLQAKEASRLTRLQDRARLLSQLQRENLEQESQVTQITDVYHVTKDTARALRVEELFTYSLDIVPRLLTIQGLRLIDLVQSAEHPTVLRARRVPDGRLVPDHTNHLAPLERAVLDRLPHATGPMMADAKALGCELPAGVLRVAWVPLWGEQRPIGALIAEELPQEQLETLAIVANQLSLQLARVHFYQAIETMAVTDSLTGVFVRRYFLELAREELVRAARHRLPCAVLMVDLDLFKAKNDAYGHLVGDTVLREVARLIRQKLREIDLMARYGGEEFVALLVETGPDQAMLITERLRQILETSTIRAYDEAVTQTVSIGVACFPEDATDLQGLIDRADEALYAAKQAGRNRTMRWSVAMRQQQAQRAA